MDFNENSGIISAHSGEAMAEISDVMIRQMDERNREDIAELKTGLRDTHSILGDIKSSVAVIADRIKDQKELETRVSNLEADANSAKGMARVIWFLFGTSELGQWLFRLLGHR